MRIEIKTIIIILITILLSLVFFENTVRAESENIKINKLEYKVNINEDGSIDVTEVWDLSINGIKEITKNFINLEKNYFSVSNIEITDLTNGKNYKLSQISKERQKLDENSFYIQEKDETKTGLTWKVGIENTSTNKKYEINYHVSNAIAKYNDYTEFHWVFLGSNFNMNVNEITGTIIFPETVKNMNEIKIWEHIDNLNKEFYYLNENTIKFKIYNYEKEKKVEIRILMPKETIKKAERTFEYNIEPEVIQQENTWKKQENLKIKWTENKNKIAFVFLIYLVVYFCIIYAEKTIKYVKMLKQLKKCLPRQKMEYYKRIPKKDFTPGEAQYILEESYNNFINYFNNIFEANIFNLYLKKYIEIKIENVNEEKNFIKTKKIKEKKNENLQAEEKQIYNFIINAMDGENTIKIKDLEEYIIKNHNKVQQLIEQSEENIEKQLIKEKIINKNEEENYKLYKDKSIIYYFMGILLLIFFIFPLSVILLTNGFLCKKISKNTNVLTQEGIDLKEKLRGLKKYIEEIGKQKENKIPEIGIWKKYLVYAIAWGIEDKVKKQLKIIYPDIDKINEKKDTNFMYIIYEGNITTSNNKAIKTSILSSTMKEENN